MGGDLDTSVLEALFNSLSTVWFDHQPCFGRIWMVSVGILPAICPANHTNAVSSYIRMLYTDGLSL